MSEQEDTSTLIQEIEFQVTTTDPEKLEIYEDGIISHISIADPASEWDNLLNADEIILEFNEVLLILDYPLENQAEFMIQSQSQQGFSRKELIDIISQKYHQIYKEEEGTAETKTIPLDEREVLINRNETDGIYGIWGHDIIDLVLSSIQVMKQSDGKIVLELDIYS